MFEVYNGAKTQASSTWNPKYFTEEATLVVSMLAMPLNQSSVYKQKS